MSLAFLLATGQIGGGVLEKSKTVYALVYAFLFIFGFTVIFTVFLIVYYLISQI